MPLVWITDKIIAGRYRLKKPIPVDTDSEYDACKISLFDTKYNYVEAEMDDVNLVKEIERILRSEHRRNVDNEPYCVEEDIELRWKLLDYLELK